MLFSFCLLLPALQVRIMLYYLYSDNFSYLMKVIPVCTKFDFYAFIRCSYQMKQGFCRQIP